MSTLPILDSDSFSCIVAALPRSPHGTIASIQDGRAANAHPMLGNASYIGALTSPHLTPPGFSELFPGCIRAVSAICT
jgi:hypothetical protein